MNMKQLEAFVYVAEEKNFTRAAKLLYMTQPAISFQIKALEDHLGIKLFERMEKKVYLTDGGEILYPQAKKILGAYASIKDGIVALNGLEKGRMTIGASTIPGEYLLPRLIGQFKDIYPSLHISLAIGSTAEMVHKLTEREIDIAVIGAMPDDIKFETFKLANDQLVLIAPPNFEMSSISLENLKGQPLIVREIGSGTRRVIEEELNYTGISFKDLNIQMELGSTRAVLTAVEAGLGLSFVSHWAVKEALQLKKVKVVEVDNFKIHRYLYGALNPNKYNNSVTKAFQSFIKEASLTNQYM